MGPLGPMMTRSWMRITRMVLDERKKKKKSGIRRGYAVSTHGSDDADNGGDGGDSGGGGE